MIDLSRDAVLAGGDPSCGACEFCVQEAHLGIYSTSDANLHCVQTPSNQHNLIPVNSTDANGRARYRSEAGVRQGILKNKQLSINERSPEGNMIDSEAREDFEIKKPPLIMCLILVGVHISIGVFFIKSWNANWTLTESFVQIFDSFFTIFSGIELTSKLGFFTDADMTWRRIIMFTSYLLIGYSFLAMTLISVSASHRLEQIVSFGRRCYCLASDAKVIDERQDCPDDNFDHGVG